jgi:hypothetical protein
MRNLFSLMFNKVFSVRNWKSIIGFPTINTTIQMT